MLNLFRRNFFQKLLDDIIASRILSFIFHDKEGAVALQVLKRKQQNDDPNNITFVIFIYFHNKKPKNDYYFDRFSKYKHFNKFYHWIENNSNFYTLDVINDRKTIEKITLEILLDVYEIKDKVLYPTIEINK